MKIDIHAHTIKTKSGDPQGRTIGPDELCEILKSTEVGIVAVTNHNHFDLDQYLKIVTIASDSCQVWPGVELDIAEADQRGHLLVIVNPKYAQEFASQLKKLRGRSTADEFSASLGDIIPAFNPLDAIYVAHYYIKKPALSDDAIKKLITLAGKRSRVIKEATDALSAGIYVGHGHQSIFGSDVTDWSKYIEESRALPDLRLPVDSFEQFCLLLDKDEPTIDTILNAKKHESIKIKPFVNDKPIELTVYNDINIFFGSKGTGKTELLKAIARHYSESGLKTRIYEATNEHVDNRFDLKGSGFAIKLPEQGIDDCHAELDHLRSVQEPNVTSLSSYVAYYSSVVTNARAKAIKGADYQKADERQPLRRFEDTRDAGAKVEAFRSFLTGNRVISGTVDPGTIKRAVEVMEEISDALRKETLRTLITAKVAHLFNEFVAFLAAAVSRKTGKPKKPTTPGFNEYARNRISVERAVAKIIANLEKTISLEPEAVGDLGDKGSLFCVTEVRFQNGRFTDGTFRPLTSINKATQKRIAKAVFDIADCVYQPGLFECLADFGECAGECDDLSLNNLLLFNRRFEINGAPYSPSSGESSMLLLHLELKEDKEVYLLDEPEKSLGNDYISEVIVPLLKEKARSGKKVFIATHDANIAVRTLPYNSIYRRHDRDAYRTYAGNPFTNHLVNISDPSESLDWKSISMKTLEGGREAFGERRRIYGNP